MTADYEPPHLTVLGKIEDLTKGTGCQDRGANGFKAVGHVDNVLGQGLAPCSA